VGHAATKLDARKARALLCEQCIGCSNEFACRNLQLGNSPLHGDKRNHLDLRRSPGCPKLLLHSAKSANEYRSGRKNGSPQQQLGLISTNTVKINRCFYKSYVHTALFLMEGGPKTTHPTVIDGWAMAQPTLCRRPWLQSYDLGLLMICLRNELYLTLFCTSVTLNNIVTLNLIRGHSRSLEMTPFVQSHTRCYSSSIVTMAVSCIVLVLWRLVWKKLEWRGCPTVKKRLMCLAVSTQYRRVTATDGQTSCHRRVRAYAEHRAVKHSAMLSKKAVSAFLLKMKWRHSVVLYSII